MFEIERQSNLRPMIMAVLVGLLALASNHYSRLDLKALDAFLKRPAESSETAHVSWNGSPPAVSVLRERLPELETQLGAQFTAWEHGQVAENAPAIVSILNSIRALAVQLQDVGQSYDLSEQMSVLRMLFMSAQLRPAEFTEPFMIFCRWLEANPNRRIRAQAGVLEFLHHYDLKQPDPDRLLSAIDEFSSQYTDPHSGVRLYSLVAHSLWSHGHMDAGERVLRAGITRFEGYRGVSRLVNQMVDQEQPPRIGE